MIRPFFFWLVAPLCVAVLIAVSGLPPVQAAETGPTLFQATVNSWMAVVALVENDADDDADDDEDDDEDAKPKHRHPHHKPMHPVAPHGWHHPGHDSEQGMQHARGQDRWPGPPGRPPQMPDMNRMLMEQFNEVIARLTRIENRLGGGSSSERSSPPDRDRNQNRKEMDGKQRRGPEEVRRQLPEEQQRMMEQRMQEGRQRMENAKSGMEEARRQFKEMQQRIERLEDEIKRLKSQN